MQYQIMQQIRGREFIPVRDETTQTIVVLNSAKEAAKYAHELTKKIGGKFQPRPIKIHNDWQKREQRRFESGEYKPLVWCKEAWWKEIPHHFAHVGIKDPTRVAFTPDPEKGAADKQTVMAPGKYLQQFFGEVLTCGQIREYAMRHNTTFENTELMFAKTPEEIEAVYKLTIGSSCFSGTTKANLYGSGDFAVAYITKNGKITARSVCCPERKIYIHPYGDKHRLEDLLHKAGFEASSYDLKPWKGLRVLKKWHWDGFYADFGQPYLVADPNDPEMLVIS